MSDCPDRPEAERADGEIFKFEDMCDVTLHYWDKGYDATLIVDIPGGLEVGKEYTVCASVTIRAYYMREGIAEENRRQY